MNQWEIQFLILLSLLAQCLLVSFAFLRNRTNKKWLLILISAIYFSADWVAPYALGLISNEQDCGRSCDHCQPAITSGDLLAFWAPFLLLHLGGPSNITSISLDENDMWLKKLVELGSNVITATIVLSRATHNNWLFPASILVLVAGTSKYAERTLTLFLARSNRWENSIAELLENTEPSQEQENLPGRGQLSVLGYERSMLEIALCFYRNFKGFIVGGVSYGPRMRRFTSEFFRDANTSDAFKLVEIELSFMQEDLHTKTIVTCPIKGYTIRVCAFFSIMIAFFLFHRHDKHEISKNGIIVTYVILAAALVLEIISFVMVFLSARGVHAIGCYWLEKHIAKAIVHRRRWSNSYSRWNLISYCLHYPPDAANKLTDRLIMRATPKAFKINQTLTTYSFKYFPQETIFEYLRKILVEAGDDVRTAKERCLGRGSWAVRKFQCHNQIGWSLGGLDYANSLMRWHIATDICIRITNSIDVFKIQCMSEYLLYLLLWKPSMIAPDVDNWQPIFRQAYADARDFFGHKPINRAEARQALQSKVNDIKPASLSGSASESVWSDALSLAKQLMIKFEDKDRWDLILTVWVELLVYAAFNSQSITHARQLGEGGEVLTVVWLLMYHLGLGKKFSEAPVQRPAQIEN